MGHVQVQHSPGSGPSGLNRLLCACLGIQPDIFGDGCHRIKNYRCNPEFGLGSTHGIFVPSAQATLSTSGTRHIAGTWGILASAQRIAVGYAQFVQVPQQGGGSGARLEAHEGHHGDLTVDPEFAKVGQETPVWNLVPHGVMYTGSATQRSSLGTPGGAASSSPSPFSAIFPPPFCASFSGASSPSFPPWPFFPWPLDAPFCGPSSPFAPLACASSSSPFFPFLAPFIGVPSSLPLA